MLGFLLAIIFSVHADPSVLTVPIAEAAPLDFTTTTLEAYAVSVAQSNHLNVHEFVSTISCESAFAWNATSTTDDYGIAQINLNAHPEVSKEEALDPYWSLNWAANAWKDGNERWWVCYKLLGY